MQDITEPIIVQILYLLERSTVNAHSLGQRCSGSRARHGVLALPPTDFVVLRKDAPPIAP